MNDYVFSPPPVVSLGVEGAAARFPVRRVYCVGRNYGAHVAEMGHDPATITPVFFQKPADAVVVDDGDFPYPPATSDVHHEIELVVAIGQGGRAIPEPQALAHVFGYGVGLDMTRRDLQADAKAGGKPWDAAKAFDHSAPCSALRRAADIGHPSRGRITLAVNGALRQDADLAEMTLSTAAIIAALSRLFTLAPGDLVMTGTPAGVGSVAVGDRLEGAIEAVGRLRCRVR